ncbi:hypothetical protein F5984_11595 [Rudanella paleaurantiibacter]|uniref:Uncharacterized protein n=1 Tax=Rudanella paleaurantiibacter TaxID=2614655 RepID=A0A7J5U100_9BACT|nr:hypothetical protein [Rudanella paleaurantiibacter]KAB7731426.1 hypothetical protein F5984_11595 [Rudanella paleaurantiibacter]
MFDGIKILDVSVSAHALLMHHNLTFGGKVDLQTGAVLDHTQRANDRGLTFKIIPTNRSRSGADKYRATYGRVELAGSLHRYGRGGLHNADDFTADDVRRVVEELVSTYGINAQTSTLNNLEFGVNLRLPYPVKDLLRALICYKGVPFARYTDNGFEYYQAAFSQYAVKVYNKGEQYGLGANLLRFEVKVLKMQHLHGRGIKLGTLADLLNTDLYPALGRLLAEVFTGILFDEPGVSVDDVPTRHRELLLQGRNPRYWQLPNDLKGKEYDRVRKRLRREEEQFRKLLADRRPGNEWQSETAELLIQKWEELTRPTCPKFTDLSDRGTLTQPGVNCPKFTDLSEGCERGSLSEIYPLYVGAISDKVGSREGAKPGSRGTLPNPRPTATMLRACPALLEEVERGRRCYRKGSKEERAERAAHLLRNDQSNPRNNLKRSINKIYRQPTLFDVADTLRLDPRQQSVLGDNNGNG